MQVIKYFFDILKIEGLSVFIHSTRIIKNIPIFLYAQKEKGRDLIQSYDKSPYIPSGNEKKMK